MSEIEYRINGEDVSEKTFKYISTLQKENERLEKIHNLIKKIGFCSDWSDEMITEYELLSKDKTE